MRNANFRRETRKRTVRDPDPLHEWAVVMTDAILEGREVYWHDLSIDERNALLDVRDDFIAKGALKEARLITRLSDPERLLRIWLERTLETDREEVEEMLFHALSATPEERWRRHFPEWVRDAMTEFSDGLPTWREMTEQVLNAARSQLQSYYETAVERGTAPGILLRPVLMR